MAASRLPGRLTDGEPKLTLVGSVGATMEVAVD
jgi:hypothetical protein